MSTHEQFVHCTKRKKKGPKWESTSGIYTPTDALTKAGNIPIIKTIVEIEISPPVKLQIIEGNDSGCLPITTQTVKLILWHV